MLPGLPDVAELQLMFAQFNFLYFDGEIPTYRIAYNARFSNLAGRITYKPPTIELSPKHLVGKLDELRETLLHEMIHAWLHAKGLPPGHTPTFKKKMRELGLRSIYHDLGKAAPLNESAKRYILRCDKCAMELLRKRKPSPNLICARCRKALVAFEVTEMKPVELDRAAFRGQR
ncbi:MAG TPA: SprT-like domain-containing protein [Candidatus Limnocylindria bacterium]|nr:SprT-like domain-containing protein [Candidatus Limnocylindria bacterium]